MSVSPMPSDDVRSALSDILEGNRDPTSPFSVANSDGVCECCGSGECPALCNCSDPSVAGPVTVILESVSITYKLVSVYDEPDDACISCECLGCSVACATGITVEVGSHTFEIVFGIIAPAFGSLLNCSTDSCCDPEGNPRTRLYFRFRIDGIGSFVSGANTDCCSWTECDSTACEGAYNIHWPGDGNDIPDIIIDLRFSRDACP